MTYYEIHRMSLQGHSVSQISNHLGLDWRTVKKYLSMGEQEYETFLTKGSEKKKLLSPYEDFVKSRLETFRDTPAAQMHDWLKEYDVGFPKDLQRQYSILSNGSGPNITCPILWNTTSFK